MSFELARRADDTSNGLIVAPGCYDVLSVRLADAAGFRAAYVTPLGVLASMAGHPPRDGSLWPRLLSLVAAMTSGAPGIDLIADAHTGIEGRLPAQQAAKELEAAGAAAVVIEDVESYWSRPGELLSIAEWQDKVASARAALGPHVRLIARTDAATRVSFDAAIERCRAAFAAGADIGMPLMTPIMRYAETQLAEEAKLAIRQRVVAEAGGPLLAHSPHGTDPSLTEAAAIGYWGYVVPQLAIGSAAAAVGHSFAALAADRTHTIERGEITAPRDLAAAAGVSDWLDRRW